MECELKTKEGRKRFIKYANRLLKNERSLVSLVDKSNRTLNQNGYLHVLCRILASEIGVTERYAKDVYFKTLANPDLFIVTITDPITGVQTSYLRSTSDLTIEEMNKAINTFRHWSEENGYYLPDARVEDDGSMSFSSDYDKQAFEQAEIETSKVDQYL